jgi:hypothetical protein
MMHDFPGQISGYLHIVFSTVRFGKTCMPIRNFGQAGSRHPDKTRTSARPRGAERSHGGSKREMTWRRERRAKSGLARANNGSARVLDAGPKPVDANGDRRSSKRLFASTWDDGCGEMNAAHPDRKGRAPGGFSYQPLGRVLVSRRPKRSPTHSSRACLNIAEPRYSVNYKMKPNEEPQRPWPGRDA